MDVHAEGEDHGVTGDPCGAGHMQNCCRAHFKCVEADEPDLSGADTALLAGMTLALVTSGVAFVDSNGTANFVNTF